MNNFGMSGLWHVACSFTFYNVFFFTNTLSLSHTHTHNHYINKYICMMTNAIYNLWSLRILDALNGGGVIFTWSVEDG